jgi:hypothetical protein
MCAKRQRRCPALLAIREEAFEEWTRAETFEEVRSCWSQLGGRTTLHRRGSVWFRTLALRRWEKTSEVQS